MYKTSNGNNVDTVGSESESDSEPLLQFSMPTRNRFQWRESDEDDSGWQTKVRKQKKGAGRSISIESFKELSTDEKLNQIFGQLNRNFSKIQSLEEKQGECMRDVQIVNSAISSTNARVEQLEDAVRTLSYRSIDIEARSRRNNVIFYHITERSGLSEKRLVLQFIEDELCIDTGEMYIERAHRLGSIKQEVRRDGSDPKRPLIVKFRDYVDTETIMNKAYMLKNLPFGVDRDYPREIADARKQLFSCDEAKRARFERKNVQVRYPARLYIDGKLVDDKFPEWFEVMGQRRIGQQPRRRQLDSVDPRETGRNPSSVTNRVSQSVENQPNDLESGENQRSRYLNTSSPRARDVTIMEKRHSVVGKKSRPNTRNRSDLSSRARSRVRSENVNSKNNRQIVSESQMICTQVETVRQQRRKSKCTPATGEGVSTSDQSNDSVFIDTQPENCDK